MRINRMLNFSVLFTDEFKYRNLSVVCIGYCTYGDRLQLAVRPHVSSAAQPLQRFEVLVGNRMMNSKRSSRCAKKCDWSKRWCNNSC